MYIKWCIKLNQCRLPATSLGLKNRISGEKERKILFLEQDKLINKSMGYLKKDDDT